MFDFFKTQNSFEKHTDDIVDRYMQDGVSMNDSIIKIAGDNDYNPDQIKRIVESANAKAFQKHMGDPAREGSKDVTFDVADPDVVLKKVFVIEKKDAPSVEGGGPMDFFKDINKIFEGVKGRDEKVEDLPVPPSAAEENVPKSVLIIRIRKAKTKLEKKAFDASDIYIEKLAEVVKEFRKTGSELEYDSFCKEAHMQLGSDCHGVLTSLGNSLSKTSPDFEKMTFPKVAGFKTKEVLMVEELMEKAAEYYRYERAVGLADKAINELRG